jgi:superfamily I DNA/RNA helicase
MAIGKARDNIDKKVADLQSKPFPNESKIEALNDRSTCIGYIAENCSSVAEFCAYVDDLFKDNGGDSDIQLSSVHKSKGLEHKHVCIYKPSKLPLVIKPKKGKKGSGFQQQQECNLAYVAYTRSMDQLTFVEEDMKEGREDE